MNTNYMTYRSMFNFEQVLFEKNVENITQEEWQSIIDNRLNLTRNNEFKVSGKNGFLIIHREDNGGFSIKDKDTVINQEVKTKIQNIISNILPYSKKRMETNEYLLGLRTKQKVISLNEKEQIDYYQLRVNLIQEDFLDLPENLKKQVTGDDIRDSYADYYYEVYKSN